MTVAYRLLNSWEIVKESHYDNEFFPLNPESPYIGKKPETYIHEKVNLEDYRLLDDSEILTEEHFGVCRDDIGNLIMTKFSKFEKMTNAGSLRRELSDPYNEYKIYSKK
jgi:hypothetical protein